MGASGPPVLKKTLPFLNNSPIYRRFQSSIVFSIFSPTKSELIWAKFVSSKYPHKSQPYCVDGAGLKRAWSFYGDGPCHKL